MKEKVTKDKIRETIVPILRKHNVKRASLFGSIARGDYSLGSDIDILVELSEDISLFDFINLRLEIEDATNMKVDLVEYNTIKPSLKKYILKDQEAIL
ncbi:MAG: Nucleotidyltransferase domain protein [Candidatus Methanofastidiosum methylothiophilum]|uniref:Nucleotidyltransferase domain protein n=1 Tax=Candidatus Methanofastidiosum methylothiophilum TaxID=1705564 RepID=A0A150INS8_9EURY|nr:MAG: Nucleotidyltransferase domain protein [Candidatus Methanofastidiosum methylthiophilus]NMC77349.1 nucleotidyltransferase family protein [Candidatus Methanofastidiosa archaeon]